MTMPTEVDHEDLKVVPNHEHGILKRLQPVLPKRMEHPTLQGLQPSGDLSELFVGCTGEAICPFQVLQSL